MVRDRVERLLGRLAFEPQFPSQGATLFVDLERQQIRRAFIPKSVIEAFLEGRGANMVVLYNLLDPQLDPLDPQVPLQFSVGLLTGVVPAAARGQITGVSPETGFLMDSNCGDFFPAYMKLQGIDRFVLYGLAQRWTYLYVREGHVEFRDASRFVGLNNAALRSQVGAELGGRWGRDLAMANITQAGENGVRFAGVMGGPKALWARGGPGAKMGSLRLKAIVLQGFDPRRTTSGPNARRIKLCNRELAAQVRSTGVVKHALSVRGTPFLYKPSRLLGAIGAKNNQQTRWTDALDAENIDPYRTGMTGCFHCPVKCRPLNQLPSPADDPYATGEGPDYVTVGKLGPMIGVTDIEQVLRLNNMANDLGLDTASLGSSIAWAMELWQRGIISAADTNGLELAWGDYRTIEKLLTRTATREGFGDVIAEGAAAVAMGKYPKEAAPYCMAVKGLMQSDPHDARIIKAFALGLAVATRGMDHLRNRPTLEINGRINEDRAFKKKLYGGRVAADPTSYEGKENAVRRCEDIYAVGDAVGLCRFATQLFNSPNLLGYEPLAQQIQNLTGLRLSTERMQQAGRNITGLERMINYDRGLRREHDTLPPRWLAESIPHGPHKGERIDPKAFQALLSRFYELTGLNEQGQPKLRWRAELTRRALGFAVEVILPPSLAPPYERGLVLTDPVSTVGQLLRALGRQVQELADEPDQGAFAVVVNSKLIVKSRAATPISNGDRVELTPALGGG